MPRRFGFQIRKNGAPSLLGALADLRGLISALDQAIGDTPDETPLPDQPGHVPTEVDNQGRIVVPEGVAPARVSSAIRAAFPREIWGDAARVAFYESGWSADAERNTLDQAGGRCSVPIGTLPDGTPIVSEQSVGIFQINVCAHGYDAEHWQEVEVNVEYAGRLYRSSGWAPWSHTAHRLHLD